MGWWHFLLVADVGKKSRLCDRDPQLPQALCHLCGPHVAQTTTISGRILDSSSW